MIAIDIDYDRLAEAIAVRLPAPKKTNLLAEFWSLKEIADCFKVSVEHARRITAIEGFPAPVRLPSGDTSGHPRWRAIRVIEFFETYEVGK